MVIGRKIGCSFGFDRWDAAHWAAAAIKVLNRKNHRLRAFSIQIDAVSVGRLLAGAPSAKREQARGLHAALDGMRLIEPKML